ncbi:hypothetical protein [Nonomuraea deserti]|uniref:hypothetical protein n=1 Tax=Nonomuraea deserti TaxID=1848322 RepID=UPI0034E07485
MVERSGFLGGNLTAGLVGPCMTSFSLDGGTQLIRGADIPRSCSGRPRISKRRSR